MKKIKRQQPSMSLSKAKKASSNNAYQTANKQLRLLLGDTQQSFLLGIN